MRAVVAFSTLDMMRGSARRNAEIASVRGGKEFPKPKHLPLTNKWSPRHQLSRWSASVVFLSAMALLLVLLLSSAAQAAKRVALVIGNSAYKHTSELANPRNDAADVAAALKAHGFQVITGLDLDKAALDNKVRDFAVALQGADVGLFFYAGHGLQVSGQNYLVPIDAQLTTASALEFEMVTLTRVHRIMESEAQTNILIIDACRDNPLARNLARAMGTRSLEIGRGLAAVESGVGTLISFSTQPGNVALDGTGRNSPFAGALTKHMSSSNDDLSTLLIKVRNDVIAQTKRRQVPWEHSALTGQFYFRAQAEPKPDSRSPSLSEAERTWMLIKDTESVAVLAAFIARYKDTFYAEVARERIEELKTRATAALEARRNAEEAEQRRLAALRAEQELRAKAAAEAEARRNAAEAEQRRLAALKMEEERRARAAAEAEALAQAKRRAEEAEQQRLAALRAEQERVWARFSDAMSQGEAAYKSENWNKAITDFSEAIRVDPKPVAFLRRGGAYQRSGDQIKAIADFSEAIRLNPRYAAAFNGRGISYRNIRNYDRAIADLDEAIRLDPNGFLPYYSRAAAYKLKGDHDRSIADFSKAIRLNPGYARSFIGRGIAYGIKRDYRKAIADFNEAIRLDPQNADAFCNRGIAKLRTGNKGGNADIAKAKQLGNPSFC